MLDFPGMRRRGGCDIWDDIGLLCIITVTEVPVLVWEEEEEDFFFFPPPE